MSMPIRPALNGTWKRFGSTEAQVDSITKRLSGDVGGNMYMMLVEIDFQDILFRGEVSNEEKLWKFVRSWN